MNTYRWLLNTLFALLILCGSYSLTYGQTFTDSFTGAGNIGGTGNLSSNNGWTTHNPASGGGEIPITTGSLAYPGLQTSTGNKVSIPGSNSTVQRDVNAALSLGTGISVAYFSALINVIDNTQLSTSFDYFMHFGNNSGTNNTTFFGRLHIKKNTAGTSYRLGIQNTTTGTVTQTEFASDLSFGTTYLVVVKYDFNGTSNDIATLWVNPTTLGGTEPSGGVTNSSGTSTSNNSFASICIRNGSNTPKADIDEIRAGTTWASVTPVSSVSSTLSATPLSINNFTYVYGFGPSASQTVTITGSGLIPASGTLIINESEHYEVSSDNISFGSSASVGYSQGALSGVNAYIRLKAGLAVASYNTETIQISGGGASNVVISCNGSVTAASSPSITVGTITGFGNQAINSYSAENSYLVSGTYLTANLLIIPPTGFEISTGTGLNFIPTNPITLSPSSGTVSPTYIYVRFLPTLLQSYSGSISHISSSVTQNVDVTGTGVKPQPSNQATNFISDIPGSSSLNLTWSDNDGVQAAGAFLILANTTGTFTAPVDGTIQADDPILSDGSGRMNIAHGLQTLTWTGLNPSTPYYYAIYPYTNSGTAINYKTSATTPTAAGSTQAQIPITYTWQGANNAAWNVATNWTPARTTPAANDILQFNDATSKTVTALQTQTIGRLVLGNNTIVNLQSTAAATLTIAGGSGVDLEIPAGCSINLNNGNAITIALSAGATGIINGNIAFSAGAHRLTSAAASGIIFGNNSSFTAGTGFTGSPFGTTSPFNTIVFENGSSYISQAGSNPFGAALPNSIVVFQTGSLYKIVGSTVPAFSGRTYGNLEMDAPGITLSPVGTASVSIDNLSITNGTLNFNTTGSPGHSIKGNIYVAPGSTLSFSPLSSATINLNGSGIQTISGGGSITTGGLSTLVINNSAGVMLNSSLIINGSLTLSNGLLTLASGNLLLGPLATVSGSLSSSAMIVATGTGELRKEFPASGGSFTFPIGEISGSADYSPCVLNFTSGTFSTGNYATVKALNIKFPSDPNTFSYLNRYWTIASAGISNYSCNIQFNYISPSDVVGNEGDILCVKIDPSPIGTFDPANTSLHQLSALNQTNFGSYTGTQTSKIVSIKLFLEGLYTSNGIMRKAQDESGDKFPGVVADQINIELHSSLPGDYSNINYSSGPTNLNTSGIASFSVPLTLNGSYYLSIKHRNSLETVSALPVSFASGSAAYDLTDNAAKAFGSNMKMMGDGKYAIFGGDINKDGFVDTGDYISIDNGSYNYLTGYQESDTNGDGLIDTGDMIVVDNNAALYIGTIAP
jgi:hypothetical protein